MFVLAHVPSRHQTIFSLFESVFPYLSNGQLKQVKLLKLDLFGYFTIMEYQCICNHCRFIHQLTLSIICESTDRPTVMWFVLCMTCACRRSNHLELNHPLIGRAIFVILLIHIFYEVKQYRYVQFQSWLPWTQNPPLLPGHRP